jgi:4-hydroxy-tetrahydrodipicolinate synthase
MMLYSADFPEGFRAALRLRGIEVGEGRQPYSRDQHLQMETLSNSLACLLAEEGFADEPVGGCPVGAQKIDPEQVGQIVRGVLAELKQRGLA